MVDYGRRKFMIKTLKILGSIALGTAFLGCTDRARQERPAPGQTSQTPTQYFEGIVSRVDEDTIFMKAGYAGGEIPFEIYTIKNNENNGTQIRLVYLGPNAVAPGDRIKGEYTPYPSREIPYSDITAKVGFSERLGWYTQTGSLNADGIITKLEVIYGEIK